MAITRPNPNTLTGIIHNDLHGDIFNPYGGSAVVSNTSYNQITQYNIHNLPDCLRGMNIEASLKTITHDIDAFMYNQHGSDQAFKDNIKRQMCAQLADAAYGETTFTQIKDPIMDTIKVRGRVVIMTIDQLNKLIQRVR